MRAKLPATAGVNDEPKVALPEVGTVPLVELLASYDTVKINPKFAVIWRSLSKKTVVLDTTQNGSLLDPAAPAESKISALAIERESFRGTWLAVTATMLEPVSSESLAGIYLTNFPSPQAASAGNGNLVNGNSDPQPQLTAKERKREIKKLKKRIANLRKKMASVNRFKKQSLRLQLQELRQELALLKNGS